MENVWYAEHRRKIIPEHLLITPLVLSVWYFDDGHNCFSYKEVDFLIEQLKTSFGIIGSIIPSALSRGCKPQIYIGKKSYYTLMDVVSPHLPCKCMEYKIGDNHAI